jgi:HK97 gp10 family phage protein
MARKQVVTVDGMGLLAKKLRQLPDTIQDGIRAAVKDETDEIADDMRRNAARGTPPTKPVTLVEGIQSEVTKDGLSGTAAATARHSVFVEHGTSDTPEQPFAGPAAERARQRFPDTVKKHVGAELKEVVK